MCNEVSMHSAMQTMWRTGKAQEQGRFITCEINTSASFCIMKCKGQKRWRKALFSKKYFVFEFLMESLNSFLFKASQAVARGSPFQQNCSNCWIGGRVLRSILSFKVLYVIFLPNEGFCWFPPTPSSLAKLSIRSFSWAANALQFWAIHVGFF